MTDVRKRDVRTWRGAQMKCKSRRTGHINSITRRVQACHVHMPASHVALSRGLSVLSWYCAHCLCAIQLCRLSCLVSRVCVVCVRVSGSRCRCVPCPPSLSPGVSWCVCLVQCTHPAYAPAVAFACSEWAEGWSLSERDICSTDTVLPFQPGEGVLGDLIHDSSYARGACEQRTYRIAKLHKRHRGLVSREVTRRCPARASSWLLTPSAT